MNITIDIVWQRISPELASEIVHFWTSNQLLPPDVAAMERAKQVILVVRENTTRQVVGVTSADHIQFKQLNSNYFFLYRQAVLNEARIPGLSSKLAMMSREVLEAYSKSMKQFRCIGMLTFVENPRMREVRNEAIWPASGFVYIGSDKEGRHIRVSYFKNARV